MCPSLDDPVPAPRPCPGARPPDRSGTLPTSMPDETPRSSAPARPVAVVTGAARRIGASIAGHLHAAGYDVVVHYRQSADEARALVARLERTRPASAIAVSADLASTAACADLVSTAAEWRGRIDALVNNSVLRPMKDWTSPAADFAKSMEVNATGLFLMTRAFGEEMANRGRGSIVNVGSIQGSVGPDCTLYEGLGWGVPPDYYFHKGGLLQLTRYAAAKLGPRGVRVNAVSPGGFFNDQDPRFVERYNARTFLGRMANQYDLKGAIVFLASDASAYVTGANIAVDGGYTCK